MHADSCGAYTFNLMGQAGFILELVINSVHKKNEIAWCFMLLVKFRIIEA